MDEKIPESQPNNPLHGVTLLDILEYLHAEHGFEKLHEMTGIKVFTNRPTLKSSLKMLRRTPWAREKLEELYKKSFTPVRKKKSKNNESVRDRIKRK